MTSRHNRRRRHRAHKRRNVARGCLRRELAVLIADAHAFGGCLAQSLHPLCRVMRGILKERFLREGARE